MEITHELQLGDINLYPLTLELYGSDGVLARDGVKVFCIHWEDDVHVFSGSFYLRCIFWTEEEPVHQQSGHISRIVTTSSKPICIFNGLVYVFST